jgi:hypothetical protein
MARSRILIDTLESRLLLNGGGGPEHEGEGNLWLPPQPATPVALADYNKAVAARTQVQTDQTNIQADLKALQTAIGTAKTNLASQLAPLQTALAADETAEQAALKVDQTVIQAVYTADQPAISLDYKNIVNDIKTNNTTQLALDKTQLAADQAKLKADLVTPLATLKADDATWDAKEAADELAIHNLIFSDAGVAAAQTKLTTDQGVYTTDLNTFITDRTQLLADIKAGV